MLARTPMGGGRAHPEELISLLAGDAGSYLTGSTRAVDGG